MNIVEHAQKALLDWYEKNGRHDLLWRNTDDIYHIYLSEIMLQQTQVDRVEKEYYPRFLEKFPTLKVLARAPLDDVLAAWSGLGYYTRARNLHKSAQICQEGMPKSFGELLELPGVGRYTASAVCSFGYNQSIGVVDTNIARVMKRLYALEGISEKIVHQKAEDFLNTEKPREHNLALMDLGAMICLPQKPKCNLCPLVDMCQGKTNPELYTKTKKKEYEALDLFYGVFIEDEKIALVEAQGGMYKGMLELPSVDPIDELFLGSFKHSYTKYRLRVHLYNMQSVPDEVIWIKLDDFDKAPISSLTKKAKQFF